MASPINAVLCALVGAAFWSAFGYAIARHLLPRVLALGAAPVIGWAVFSAAALPILTLVGFSPRAVAGVAALGLVIAGATLLLRPPLPASGPDIGVPPWWFVFAAFAALAPAVALLPKYSAHGVHLAAPIFDHSKIAIIDAMTRQGLPPVNPVFGEGAAAGHLAYYYLWHFSAAALALPLHASGWEADIGLTWFTAFASLTLLMAIAAWLSKNAAAAIVAIALAMSASLREALSFVAGDYGLQPFLQAPTGFGGWLFQSAWVPQHLMSATCVAAALLLIVHYVQRQSLDCLIVLTLIVAAGFESSAFVGGVTFAIAALVSAPLLLGAIEKKRRLRVVIAFVVATVLAACLAAPLIRDQLGAVSARGSGDPILVHPFEVLGTMFSPALRRILDIPAYWLILLPIEFPATFVAGAISLLAILAHTEHGPEKTAMKLFAVLAAAGLSVSWLLVSTLGDNNDLGLRAVLPAAMILIAAAAAGVIGAPRRALRTVIAITAIGGLVLSLPDTAAMIVSNSRGTAVADGAAFAQTPELWDAVRRYARSNMRIANNPLFLQDLTPWPGNMSWALLANRSSCFAGREMAIPFAPLSPDRREAINAQFIRVFAGEARPTDVGDLASKYGCDVAVVVPQDGAWANDPFATSADYRLAETRNDRWRIYVRK